MIEYKPMSGELTKLEDGVIRAEGAFYMQPEHGWCCFFCGDVFTNHYTARQHFGYTEQSTSACRIKAGEGGLIRQLRAFENQLRELQHEQANEDTKLQRVIDSMQVDHATAIRQAEESGYAKGLSDGMALKGNK